MSQLAPSAAVADLFARKGAAGPGGGTAPVGGPGPRDPAPPGEAKSTDHQDDPKTAAKTRGVSEAAAPGSLHTIDFRRTGALEAALTHGPGEAAPEADAEVQPDRRPHNGVSAPGTARSDSATGSQGPFLALLAIVCFAVGLWYALSNRETGPREDAATAQPEAPAAPSQQQGPERAARPDSVAPGGSPGEPAAAPAQSRKVGAEPQAEASGETGPQPTFDLIRIEPNGEAVIAGRAAPDSQLILLDNGQPIGKVTADWAGEWAFIPSTPLAPGDHEFSLVIVTPQGTVAVPGVGKLDKGSFLRTPDLGGGPVIKAKAVDGMLPEQPASEVPSHKDRAGGGAPSFVVQLSSTTTLEGAEQEWLKLKRSFPQLLGDKDLDVHEAALGRRGTWFRVRTGAFTEKASARKLCAQLHAKRQDCLVIER